jgi:hypothetical protein
MQINTYYAFGIKLIIIWILIIVCTIYTMYTYGKNSITITQNKNNILYGRYTVATRYIPKGTIIMIEDPIIIYNTTNQYNLKFNEDQKNLIKQLHPIESDELDELNELHSKCYKNAFDMSNNKRGVFYKASMFNHSCEPNIKYYFVGDKIVMIPRRDIYKGEELTITYIDCVKYSFKERQFLLKLGWNFDCKCPKCINELE